MIVGFCLGAAFSLACVAGWEWFDARAARRAERRCPSAALRHRRQMEALRWACEPEPDDGPIDIGAWT